MPSPCRRDPAMALRGRFQKGIFVAWQGNGMVCVNQTRPHCVNQIGNTQSNALVERHGRGTAWEQHGNGMVCVNPPSLTFKWTLWSALPHCLLSLSLSLSLTHTHTHTHTGVFQWATVAANTVLP
jgi:hypothetical protein